MNFGRDAQSTFFAEEDKVDRPFLSSSNCANSSLNFLSACASPRSKSHPSFAHQKPRKPLTSRHNDRVLRMVSDSGTPPSTVLRHISDRARPPNTLLCLIPDPERTSNTVLGHVPDPGRTRNTVLGYVFDPGTTPSSLLGGLPGMEMLVITVLCHVPDLARPPSTLLCLISDPERTPNTLLCLLPGSEMMSSTPCSVLELRKIYPSAESEEARPDAHFSPGAFRASDLLNHCSHAGRLRPNSIENLYVVRIGITVHNPHNRAIGKHL